MEPLVTSFLAALLAEWGDKTQLLVVALAARFARPGAVLAGVALAALLNCVLAAFLGGLLSEIITPRALSLLVAVALLFAGIAGFLRSGDAPDMGTDWKVGAFVATLVCFFLLEFADKTQFLTFALAAQYDAFALAAAGATAGVIAANAPAVALAGRFTEIVPVRAVRFTIAGLFLFAGALVAVNALRLI